MNEETEELSQREKISIYQHLEKENEEPDIDEQIAELRQIDAALITALMASAGGVVMGEVIRSTNEDFRGLGIAVTSASLSFGITTVLQSAIIGLTGQQATALASAASTMSSPVFNQEARQINTGVGVAQTLMNALG